MTKKAKSPTKLELRRKTVRKLDERALQRAAGGTEASDADCVIACDDPELPAVSVAKSADSCWCSIYITLRNHNQQLRRR